MRMEQTLRPATDSVVAKHGLYGRSNSNSSSSHWLGSLDQANLISSSVNGDDDNNSTHTIGLL